MKRVLFFTVIIFFSTQNFAQTTAAWKLEKMPVALETDYALSALPPHLRKDATVYLLDPEKGFYVGHQGSNGYICFVSRTEWEWSEFRQDVATPISYDAEGARTIFPIYMDVAAMRASGKYLATQILDSIRNRINTGVYKAPAKPGMSYMLAPIMRLYPGNPPAVKEPISVSMPHYMFYAPPYLTEENARYKQGTDGIFLANPDSAILGDGKGPYGYIIVPATAAEKAIIVADGKDLVKRLIAYKAWFEPGSGTHHHGTGTN